MRTVRNKLMKCLLAWCLVALFGAGTANAQIEAWVANFGGTVSVIDTTTNTVTFTIPVGAGAQDVDFTPNGAFAYVVNTNAHTISIIDTATHTVITTLPAAGPLTLPVALELSNNGAFAYLALDNAFSSDQVAVIATATNTVVATITAANGPKSMALNPSGTSLWVGDFSGRISVIDTATNTVTSNFPVGSNIFGIAFTPNGAFAYTANLGSNNVAQVNTASHAVTTFSAGNRPFGVAITPNGAFAYVSNAASNDVSVIDIINGNSVAATIPVGLSPTGLDVTPNGAFTYVPNAGSNTVSVIDTATNTVVATVPVGSFPEKVAFTPDSDLDGVPNGSDHCPATAPGATVDSTGCSIAQLCPCAGPFGTTDSWKNHGEYVSCVSRSAQGFVDAGLISDAQKDAIVTAAGESSCGKQSCVPTFSNFAFGSGAPFGGNTVVAGVGVTLSSTNTERFGPTSFRDNGGANPAQVQFTFSAPITEFHLDVSRVRADEFLTAFSIGNPTSLSGTLVNQGGFITTSLPFPNDFGSGRLSWEGINTKNITFTIGGPLNTALAVDQFGLCPRAH